MSGTPAPPRGPFRVATTTDAVTGRRQVVPPPGVSAWDLRSGRYRRLLRGVYVSATVPVTPVVAARAGLLAAGPDAVASHHTAARVWGAVVPDDGLVHVTGRPRLRGAGLMTHRPKPGQRGTTRRGVRVTTPASTFLDLSDGLGLVDLVVAGDSLVKAGVATPAQLVEAATAYRGKSRRLARRAASLVRSDVDSPMESRVRMLMVLAGLPEPVVDHRIRWPGGRVRFRFDLSFPDARLVIEYDGRQHADSDEQWDSDVDRRERMDGDKWRLVIVRSKDVYRTPARTLSRITAAMRDQGMRVPRLSDAWRLHFPSLPEDVAVPA
ncbi:hypothetical protein [Intrasporangium sp. YIM S08009]|uniref:hypothetical protein n=1 Tax=Intrasporangium zincisolvens TaxID=3080018 RepID=UPI002B05BADC|nr:hypothetical protein [Intrasporangium sp. YIM S08009]